MQSNFSLVGKRNFLKSIFFSKQGFSQNELPAKKWATKKTANNFEKSWRLAGEKTPVEWIETGRLDLQGEWQEVDQFLLCLQPNASLSFADLELIPDAKTLSTEFLFKFRQFTNLSQANEDFVKWEFGSGSAAIQAGLSRSGVLFIEEQYQTKKIDSTILKGKLRLTIDFIPATVGGFFINANLSDERGTSHATMNTKSPVNKDCFGKITLIHHMQSGLEKEPSLELYNIKISGSKLRDTGSKQ